MEDRRHVGRSFAAGLVAVLAAALIAPPTAAVALDTDHDGLTNTLNGPCR